jgi:nitroreductase
VHRHARFCVLAFFIFLSTTAAAQTLSPMKLPPPRTDGGRPLMQVLKERHTTREFTLKPLSSQTLSDLLWAAFGINRADGHRTAPSARNWQEIDVYITLPEGAYVYDAKANVLQPVVAADLRAATGTQPYVGQAAVNLVYVSDGKKTGGASAEDRTTMTYADTGFIAQNVYLFCASEGLVSVVRASVDRAALGRRLNLRPEQQITLAQSVGYPKQ